MVGVYEFGGGVGMCYLLVLLYMIFRYYFGLFWVGLGFDFGL